MEEIDRSTDINNSLVLLYNEVHTAAQKRRMKTYNDDLAFVTHAIRQVYKYNTEITLEKRICDEVVLQLQIAGFMVTCENNEEYQGTKISWY